jgi:hypothetical protein
LAILRGHFAHLVEEFLLAVEVRLWVLQGWWLVHAASAGHGHDHVGILRQLGALAARAGASKVCLAHSRLHVPELRHAARPTVGCLQWSALVCGVHHLDVACGIEPLDVRPGLLGVLLVACMASSSSIIVIHYLIVCPSLVVELPHRRVWLPLAARPRRRAADVEEDAARDRQGIAGVVRVHLSRAAAKVRLIRRRLPGAVSCASQLDDVVATRHVGVCREGLYVRR